MGVAAHLFPGVHRITGLDPAGPAFDDLELDLRLDSSDADFVDVIHTNAGTLLTGHFGFLPALGHADFYVNGGTSQTGCPNFILDSLLDIITLQPSDIDACSHGRAHEYFLESIDAPQPTLGFKCASYDQFKNGDCLRNPSKVMGFTTDTQLQGIYFLDTQAERPYFARQLEVMVEVATGEDSYHGQLFLQIDIINRTSSNIEIFSGWEDVIPGDTFLTMMTVPANTNPGDVPFVASYKKNQLMPFSPGHLNVKIISATDALTNHTYCTPVPMALLSGKQVPFFMSDDAC